MQRIKLKPIWVALLTLGLGVPALTLQVSCEIKPISELSPEDGIVRLRGLHNDESWERLIQEVNEYRSRFPYSQYASEAELLQGDAYFRTKRYPEAISNYEDFVKRNPSHPQADFALLRVAKSFDLQSPEDEEREQATTQRALDKYAELKRRFPRSQHVAESDERSAVLRKRLADHHIFIANFYWKKNLYHAALNRYLYVANTFEEQKELQAFALQRASESYLWLAKELERNPKSDAVSFFTAQTPEQLKEKSAELLAKRKSLLGVQSPKTPEKEG
jgi:outer membrane protein assembly factor BamD